MLIESFRHWKAIGVVPVTATVKVTVVPGWTSCVNGRSVNTGATAALDPPPVPLEANGIDETTAGTTTAKSTEPIVTAMRISREAATSWAALVGTPGATVTM